MQNIFWYEQENVELDMAIVYLLTKYKFAGPLIRFRGELFISGEERGGVVSQKK